MGEGRGGGGARWGRGAVADGKVPPTGRAELGGTRGGCAPHSSKGVCAWR